MTRLALIEIRRDLARRTTVVLVLLATVLTAIAAVATYVNTEQVTEPVGFSGGEGFVRLTDLSDDALGAAAFFLLMGALIGGASMVGAEWRAGTVGLQLVWESRRIPVLIAKVVAAAVLAATIGFLLLALFLGALAVTPVVKGTTAGADGEWWADLLAGMLRVAGLAGLTAAAGAALASIGRNTATALAVLFVHVTVVENVIRGLRPNLERWLVGTNLGVVVDGSGAPFGVDRSPLTAGLTLLVYAVVVVAVAAVLFDRRDLAGSS